MKVVKEMGGVAALVRELKSLMNADCEQARLRTKVFLDELTTKVSKSKKELESGNLRYSFVCVGIESAYQPNIETKMQNMKTVLTSSK